MVLSWFDRNWPAVTTSKDRYEFVGINDFIFDHIRQGGIKDPTIIDVGCSTGIAIKNTVEILRKQAFNSYVIGINASKTIKSKAEKNVDRFINKDVLDVESLDSTADIVICHKAAIFVRGTRRADIIRKCATFLKDSGILITDVDCYPQRTFMENMLRFSRHLWYQIPAADCLKHGIKNIRREYDRRANTTIKEGVFKKTKAEAISYADEIMTGWEKRSDRWKRWWQFRIFMLGLVFSF